MILYDVAIGALAMMVRLCAVRNKKAALMVKGWDEWEDRLKETLAGSGSSVWFHAASLGEFEQGRPLMERIKARHPEWRLVVTFFSPSGYEVRKDYRGADVVCYLPPDTPRHVARFLDLARPRMAFFIKYEFWKNYLDELHRRHIPVYSVSSIFRPGQLFFKWYGAAYRRLLHHFDRLFVQDEASEQLLGSVGVTRVTVAGDTRFDRVIAVRNEAKQLPLLDAFCQGCGRVVVAGSTWRPDEDLLLPYFNSHRDLKLVIAPHLIDEGHLKAIEAGLSRPCVRYSQATPQNVAQADCLIVDCIGLLSSVYRHGHVAYVGGGFGAGIHNTLEAAVYGVPVVFGPRHQAFAEALGLAAAGGAFAVSDAADLGNVLDQLFANEAFLEGSGRRAGLYVESKAGATDLVLGELGL